jgi:hypothetical protein
MSNKSFASKARLTLVGVCMLFSASAQASLIGKDDFETPTPLGTNSDVQNRINLVWSVVNRATVADAHVIDTSAAAGGIVAQDAVDNDGFLDSTKTDRFFAIYRGAALGGPRTLTYTFDISGFKDLYLSMDWAASGDVPDPGITMACSIDGAAPATIFRVGTSNTNWSETMETGAVVTNARSATVTVNGAADRSLTDLFQTYQAAIGGTGSVLTVTLTMASGVAGPAYGLDNLELHGTGTGPAPGYESWISAFGLGASDSKATANPDGDNYDNFLEYALGLHPAVADAAGADRLELSNGSARITLPRPARDDVFYQIMRSSDAAPGNPYEDWEIFASRWKTDPWVGDHAVDDPASGSRQVSFEIPASHADDQFKCVVIDPRIYPQFSWDHVATWTSNRRPLASRDGTDQFTPADFQFIAANAISWSGLASIPNQVTGVHAFDDLDVVLAYSPLHKNLCYLNGGIVVQEDAYEGLNYSDLTYDDYGVWDELNNDWFISWTSVARPFIDYRKPLAFQRQCDIASAYKAEGNQGIFIDAMAKTGGSLSVIINPAEQAAFLTRYYDFLSHVRNTYADGIRSVNAQPSNMPALVGAACMDGYDSLEAVINAYFNSLYAEGWYDLDKDRQRETLDWFIEKWTRHGRLFQIASNEIAPNSRESMMHLACVLTVMGRNTFVRGHNGSGYELSYTAGGWKNPTYSGFLGDRMLGEPLADAVRVGYVYTREFQFARVKLDLAERACRIEWLDEHGNIDVVWENESNVSPNAVIIGADDFDGNTDYLTRNINSPVNSSVFTWGIVKRSSVACPAVIDTSLYSANGGPGDGSDAVGFLQSTRTDNIFAMYRVDNATMTYTFDVTGYNNLSLKMDWAVSGDMPNIQISVDASIDGDASQHVFGIESSPNFSPNFVMENGRKVVAPRMAIGKENGYSAKILSNGFSTFASRIEGSGSTLTLVISQLQGVGGCAFGLDNLKLYGETAGGYNEWISGYALTGIDVLPSADRDADLMNNFSEYALGGNPLDRNDTGHTPSVKLVSEGGPQFLEYVYPRRTTPNHGLIYTVETSSTLLPDDWRTGGMTELQLTEPIEAGFEAVTNRAPVAENKGFARLRIESSR